MPHVRNNDKITDESFDLHNYQEHNIISLIMDALEAIQYKFDQCKGVLHEAYVIQLTKMDISYKSFNNRRTFTQQLTSIGVDYYTAMNVIIARIKENKSINNNTPAEEFIQLILDILEQNWKQVTCT
eukprot:269189_1